MTKREVIAWLKRSLDAVKNAHVGIKPDDLERRSSWRTRIPECMIFVWVSSFDANEHMAHSICTNGLKPTDSLLLAILDVPLVPSGFIPILAALCAALSNLRPMTRPALSASTAALFDACRIFQRVCLHRWRSFPIRGNDRQLWLVDPQWLLLQTILPAQSLRCAEGERDYIAYGCDLKPRTN
jgi:hypothetical protein